MSKRKRNIDFIAAQKAMGKSGQSTSFEFILVITVVVVACAMIGWYLAARSQYNSAVEELESAKTELGNQQNMLARNEEKFKKYDYLYDKNGNREIAGTDRYGNTIYKYVSLTEVATRVATALAGAQATSEEVKSAINLTDIVIKIIFTSAEDAECTVSQITLNDGRKITVKLNGSNNQATRNYVAKLNSESNRIYISDVEATGSGADFSVSFVIISDKLYDGSDK